MNLTSKETSRIEALLALLARTGFETRTVETDTFLDVHATTTVAGGEDVALSIRITRPAKQLRIIGNGRRGSSTTGQLKGMAQLETFIKSNWS